LLYLGNDHGTFVSFDDGGKWELLNKALNVASYDMKVHTRENELVIATHGRSIYVVDVKPLQKLDMNKAVTAFEAGNVRHSSRWGEKRYPYSKPNMPKSEVMYYISTAGDVNIEVSKVDGDKKELILITKASSDRGFNTFSWDLKAKKYKKRKPQAGEATFVQKGKYEIVFKKVGGESKVDVEVK